MALIADCGHQYTTEAGGIGAGYAIVTESDGTERRICYDCSAERERAHMREHGKTTLYLVESTEELPCECPPAWAAHHHPGRQTHQVKRFSVTDWPGRLVIKLPDGYYPRKGRHNIAGTRRDVWFTFEGRTWHGVQYGEDTQLLHCRRLKGS
jgi:hypothetical protein